MIAESKQKIAVSGIRRALAIARDQAARGEKVLIVEAPRPESILGPMFGFPVSAPGLYEMLLPPPRNRFDTIYPTGERRLFILPSGDCRFRPTVWEMEWLISRIEPHFDCIITEYDT